MSRNELLLIDTTQTQRYIFGSNRLMENIGGSYLIAMATEQWVLQTVYEKIDKHNVRQTAEGRQEIDPMHKFEDGLTLEVLVAGGGNLPVGLDTPYRRTPRPSARLGRYGREAAEYKTFGK